MFKFIQKLKCSMPFSFNYFGHKNIVIVKRLSRQSELIKCTDCGRLFVINHDVRAILPWSCVRNFYETDLPAPPEDLK